MLTPDDARALARALENAASAAEKGRITVATRAWYNGCWDRPGHFLHHVGGQSVNYADKTCPVRNLRGLDGGFAPRTRGGDVFYMCVPDATEDEIHRAFHQGAELSQGQFLHHNRIIGAHEVSMLAWWDRTHGDGRFACNSVYIVDGDYPVDEMLLWWPRHFPLQAKHLDAAGVKLVQVKVT